MPNPKIVRSILLIMFMLGGAAGAAALLFAMRREPPRQEHVILPPLAEAVVVYREDAEEWFQGYGTARADRTANIAAEVTATVVERIGDIEPGSVVRESQPLLRLDDRAYQHAFERAKALSDVQQASLDEVNAEERSLEILFQTAKEELRVARDEHTRLANLYERKLAAKKEYDFANLALQRALRVVQGYQRELSRIEPQRAGLAAAKRAYEAEANLAALNIERCTLKAPFSGAIQVLSVDVGDQVNPGVVVLTIVDPSRVEIPLQLPASVHAHVRVGAPCRLESQSLRGITWTGEVARIAPTADEQTRTFSVFVEVDNTTQRETLLPGTFVRAQVRGPIHHHAILVPRGAVRGDHLFVAEDGLAMRRSISVERVLADRTVVSGDIRPGDRVIVSHLNSLTDGSPVRVRTTLSASKRLDEPTPSASP